MTLISSDSKRYVDIGSEAIWHSVLYTTDLIPRDIVTKIPLAIELLSNRKCSHKDALETARQINLLRDAFSRIAPENVIIGKNNKRLSAGQIANLSPVTTSCGNLYTTSDGKDLLFELVCILTYAHYAEVEVFQPN